MTEYSSKTMVELVALCKKKGIKGYAQQGTTKEKIIKLLRGEIEYKDARKKGNWSEKKQKSFDKQVKKRQLKNNLYNYCEKNNKLSILNRFNGDINDTKKISYGTMDKYKFKCINFNLCKNIILIRPHALLRNDKKSSSGLCKDCSLKKRGDTYQKLMLDRNGSLVDRYPDIINTWSDKNKYKPEKLTCQSHKTVCLKCPNKKHKDYELPCYRISDITFNYCPKCSKKFSKCEVRIMTELIKFGIEVLHLSKIEGREADLLLPELKLVIEIDGYPWHLNKEERDLAKNQLFENLGYTVIRIRDIKLNNIDCNKVICDVSNFQTSDFNKIVDFININFRKEIKTIDDFDQNLYQKKYTECSNIKYEETLEYLFPESKDIWDYDKNCMTPIDVLPGSNENVWFKCSNGHSFNRQINHVFRKDRKRIMNCPECPKPFIVMKKRELTIKGVKYNNITECCRDLSISRSYLYQKMKSQEIDIKNIDKIIEFIEKNY